MATRLDPRSPTGSQFFNDQFQQALAHWNRDRLAPAYPDDDAAGTIEHNARMARLELGFLEELRAEIRDAATAAPTDPQGFIAWFEELEGSGPGQHLPLFDWLEHESTLYQLKWYLIQ